MEALGRFRCCSWPWHTAHQKSVTPSSVWSAQGPPFRSVRSTVHLEWLVSVTFTWQGFYLSPCLPSTGIALSSGPLASLPSVPTSYLFLRPCFVSEWHTAIDTTVCDGCSWEFVPLTSLLCTLCSPWLILCHLLFLHAVSLGLLPVLGYPKPFDFVLFSNSPLFFQTKSQGLQLPMQNRPVKVFCQVKDLWTSRSKFTTLCIRDGWNRCSYKSE